MQKKKVVEETDEWGKFIETGGVDSADGEKERKLSELAFAGGMEISEQLVSSALDEQKMKAVEKQMERRQKAIPLTS